MVRIKLCAYVALLISNCGITSICLAQNDDTDDSDVSDLSLESEDLSNKSVEQPAAAEVPPPPTSTIDEAIEQAKREKPETVSPPAIVTPEDRGVVESTPTLEASDKKEMDNLEKEATPTPSRRLFGKRRVQLSLNKPKFDEGQNYYTQLYGSGSFYPMITVDWFPKDWWVNPGYSVRMGGYSATGHTAKGDGSSGTIVVNDQSTSHLIFFPIQGVIKIEGTPFSRKWVVFDAWAGAEYLWWQESRDNASSTASSDNSVYINSGSKLGTTFGGSANILLNSLDPRAIHAIRDSLGFGYVYLTPYFEIVRSLNKQGLGFGRSVIGVGFTFESSK